MPSFRQVAAEAAQKLSQMSNGSRVAAGPEGDPDWQRVHSYIADTIKDSYVLYAKLARLRGDFGGAELEELDAVSSAVRDVGMSLSAFSKNFTEGSYGMAKKEPYGADEMAMGETMDFGEPVDFEVVEGEEEAPEDFEEPPPEEGEEKEKKGK